MLGLKSKLIWLICTLFSYLNQDRYADASGAGKDVYEHVSCLSSRLRNKFIVVSIKQYFLVVVL